ncbi:MAG: hypothetical protein P1V51_21115 [Deltaproteobacteria bacterium]|nr:hypothetical protein [Deltaproteobacteria bacterium]
MIAPRHLLPLALGLTLLALSPDRAEARDNSTRIAAVGFQAVPVGPVLPGSLLSVKFAAAPMAEFSALLGVDWRQGLFSIAFGGKAILHLIPEENLNLYLAGMVLPSVGSLGLHTMAYFLGPGLAYYPPGTDNLEIFAEFGLGGGARFGQVTAAVQPPTPPYLVTAGTAVLGVHYWF